MNQKISVLDSLVVKAIRICDPDQLSTELKHISNALRSNGYPLATIESRIEFHKNRQDIAIDTCVAKDDNIIKRVVLPFTGRTTSQIASTIRRNTNLKVAFRPIEKISTLLLNNKTISKDQIGVYCFPCHCCPTVYVCETKRNSTIRLQEHLRDIRNGKTYLRNVHAH